MRVTEITSCYIGPQISPEQFIPEHFFLYLAKGAMAGFDGHERYDLQAGEYCMVCKNHLARYNKQPADGQFEKVVVVFDESFLREFQQKHHPEITGTEVHRAFISLKKDELVPNFVRSLMPYFLSGGKIDETFSKVKREELLLILLRINPELAGTLFNFGIPEKIDMEAYMNRNYKFNVSIERFAYLTGRSLSSFKRDFRQAFGQTPGQWLMKRRLQEAHCLIEKSGQKSSDIYLDLGFEDLSHFSYAFKKEFGYSPSMLSSINQNQ